jgi:hypothetical protein
VLSPKIAPPSWAARFIGCHHGQASAPQPTPERADQSMIIGLFNDPENNTTAIDSCSHRPETADLEAISGLEAAASRIHSRDDQAPPSNIAPRKEARFFR